MKNRGSYQQDARVKIASLLIYSIVVLLPLPPWAIIVISIVPWLFVAAAHLSFRRVLKPLVPVIVLALFAGVFAYVREPDLEGFVMAVVIALRMIALVVASFVVCFTTTSEALIAAFKSFLTPLARLGVPVEDIAFTLSLALRFIPQIYEELMWVRQAQRARGADLVSGGVYRRLQIWGIAFAAVFVGLFRRADAVATAMDARCFGASSSSIPIAKDKQMF